MLSQQILDCSEHIIKYSVPVESIASWESVPAVHLRYKTLSIAQAPGYISLAYLIDFRMIKLYLLPGKVGMKEVAFHFNLQ